VPFTDHCEPLVSESAEVESLLTRLTQQVTEEGWRYFEMRPVQYVPPPQVGLGISTTYFLHRLNLQTSQEALFKSFHKSCIQRVIAKAERNSLRYEQESSEKLLPQFYKLLIMTRRRLGLPPQPLKWFRNLVACLGQDLKIRVVFKGDVPVASILTIRTKRVMVYKYGCSDTRYNNLGGMVLLLWGAIREACEAGLQEFDLGRSDIDQEGLTVFKDHWGATRTTLNYWAYPPPSSQHGLGIPMRLLKGVVPRMPVFCLVMLGRLLYRHIA
jgi:hypothetical protein